ncbi:hypothetical protein [Streptomyces canus]|uniref:hypothetical protein n=1 Tax=Streptomyces canus TaxID=58343 RepID=UPI00277EEC9B|nr:hypothetical protein [Streptomyces canus]MDQ0758690.1 hypothetical protein [Streptomyces canus]
MSSYNWGDVQLGRVPLRETFAVSESGGDGRGLDLEGQESYPPLTRDQVIARHDGINALIAGQVIAVTFTDKPERNGYYAVKSAGAAYTENLGERVTSDWKVSLDRVGSDAETDLQSRLTGAVRLNDFSLTGERWHAPPIGHYAYYTGGTNPTTMTRTGADGTMTVYRGVASGVSPRWGCPPTSYLTGRAKATTTGSQEVYGTDVPLAATGWALSNGFVNITTSASGSLDVQTYSGGAYHSKVWNVSVAGSGASISSWDGTTLLRNDPEMVILRLVKGLNPGRATLDLTLRRGSRFVEGYLQTGTSATLAAYRATLETNTSAAASGYVTATADDADGNVFVCGSARTFTAHANGGLIKPAATAMDFFIGAVASQPTLNTNPTFETDTSQWTAVNATLTRSNAQSKYGGWSGLLTSTAGSTPRAEHARAAVTPGQGIRASGWLYSPATVGTSLGLNVNWYDASLAYLSTSSNSSTPASGVWTFMDATFTAPANAVWGGLLYAINGTPGAGVLLYGDDIRLRAATPTGDTATDLRNQYLAAMPEAVYGTRR